MIVHLDGRMAEQIAWGVLSGKDPGDVAVLADAYIQERTSDSTFSNFAALRYFIGNAKEHPDRFIGMTGDRVRSIIEDEARRIERTKLGEVITCEFWSWYPFLQAEYIAEVTNVVADAMLRYTDGRKKRRSG